MNKGSLPGSLFRLPTASNKGRHAERPLRSCFGVSTPITAVILSVDVFISVFQGDWSGAWEAVKSQKSNRQSSCMGINADDVSVTDIHAVSDGIDFK